MTSHDASPDFPPDLPPTVTYASPGDFPPEGSFPQGSPASYHAAYGVDLASLVNTLLTLLGHEVNASALTTTAMGAAVTSFGDKAAILKAIVANATAIFPDGATRPAIIIVLNALAGSVAALA